MAGLILPLIIRSALGATLGALGIVGGTILGAILGGGVAWALKGEISVAQGFIKGIKKALEIIKERGNRWFRV